ncbi:MAG: aminopeptidase P family protein [Desulfomonile tiedjei]|uniref:Aminopeptidase P family protein n=1 Tax=Desulfomonile tiedjei TaxID=2358 RepID=A0A9D6UXN5_9BACT|nr:aminopeptidase P family protein [Desulfomonile tiedjei]
MFQIQSKLDRFGVDAILFNSSEVLVSTNLRYLTGFTGSDASVIVTPTESILITDGRYKTQAKEETSGMRIRIVRNRVEAVARTLRSRRSSRLGLEASRVSHELVAQLTKKIPGLKIVPLSRDFLENLRIRKTPEEIEKIKKAAVIASNACRETLRSRLEGKRESDIAADLELLFRRGGAEGIAFPTIIASGPRGALPHGMASDKVIKSGELVVVDFGCRFEGYSSDETVTCVVGRSSEEQKRIHKAVYDAHMKVLDATKEGIGVRELDKIARQSIDQDGYGKYFLHGLGHGVGLETHEAPYLSPRGRGVLQEGMVFTVEPGIYIEDYGGVRLESLVYLSGSGPEVLSEMPKNLISVN